MDVDGATTGDSELSGDGDQPHLPGMLAALSDSSGRGRGHRLHNISLR